MTDSQKETRLFSLNLSFNLALISLTAFFLIINFLKMFPVPQLVFISISIIGLIPVIVSAVRALIKKELTIDLLASIALIFSILAREWISASFINLMLASARLFDLWTERRARKSIEKLISLRPVSVKVKKGKEVVQIPLSEVKIGDLVLVETGKRVPVDGYIIEGQASINESTLTGESEMVLKKKGDYVYESTLNESGFLIVKTDKIGENSTFAKFVSLVDEASKNRAKIERIADRFTQWYIVLSLVGAVLLWLGTHNLLLVLSILLVICADDIAVAVPLALSAAINHAAHHGVLIRGSNIIEKLSRIKIFLTDKTGTLTFGKPEVVKATTFDNFSEEKMFKIIGAAESGSTHPISYAVHNYLKEKGIIPFTPKNIDEVPGEGINSTIEGNKYFFGRLNFLQKNSIVISSSQKEIIEKEENLGTSTILVGSNKKLLGFISLQDKIRPAAKELVAKTKALGVASWVILTGDNKNVTKSISEKVGIDEYEYDLTPEEKLKYISNLKKDKTKIVAMIGDGVNDAAALALSDVSFAMGVVGSDAAIEAADVALMTDNLSRIPEAIEIGISTKKIIYQNFAIWGITNLVGLSLVLTGYLDPAGAATFNFLTDFLPIFNSLRAGGIWHKAMQG